MIAGIVVIAVIGLSYRYWGKRAGLHRAMAKVSMASMRDVVLPDGLGGDIYIDHLLLTGRGIVVIDVKNFSGTIFAGDKMDQWTVIGASGRFGFPNPQRPLQDRVFAVQQLVRGVSVEGFILFGNGADFTKGRPAQVLTAAELETQYAKPPKSELDSLANAYAASWSKIRTFARPANLAASYG